MVTCAFEFTKDADDADGGIIQLALICFNVKRIDVGILQDYILPSLIFVA